ncbi:MAG: hypothetical protein RIC55_21320 [Pirellulaceae bacterium]
MTMLQLAAALAALVPVETAVEDHFDVVHHNRHYSEEGLLVIEQVWWERWRADASRHDIIGWRLARPGAVCSPIPRRDRRGGRWLSIWIDDGLPRIVRCRSFRESWTMGADPEVQDRGKHVDWRRARRGLSLPR